ncbi:MAG TPA: SCO6880 family protein, partial [Acidimicrobiales bacterium]|nr:SCO6880 family protein [Acidimicrobiales bacterium]
EVAPHFLHALIFAADIRKSVTLLARPLATSDALKALRKEKTEALTDAHHKAKVGQVQDLSDVQEFSDLLKREQALINGHADVEFAGFITVSANSEEELSSAVALIERSAGQSGCETRVLYGRQSQGFVVAALPLGRSIF